MAGHTNALSYRLVLGLLVALAPAATAAAEALTVAGDVTDVTLYQGQALVTRTIPLGNVAGSLEVVVTELPENVLPESLYAEGGPDVDVRAVRFRSRAVGEEPREEVRKLEASIQELQDKLAVNKKSQELAAKKLAYLDKLEGFVAPTAETDLSHGVLDAASLEKITRFSFEERQAAADQQVKLEVEAREIGQQISLLERQRAELTRTSSRTVKEAVLFLQKAGAGGAAVQLNYLVGKCGWSPSYVFRAAQAGGDVEIEYNALVQQMTGEDWRDVRLTLSTASPALSAAGPGLAPFYVALESGQQQPAPQQAAQPGDLASQVRSIRQRQAAALAQNRAALNLRQNFGSAWEVNSAANDFQCVELLGGKDVILSADLDEAGGQEGPSLSYRLAGAVSVASRSDQQMVHILRGTLASRSYHVATPVLSSYVFREAEVTNSSDEDLLGGPVTVYLDGRFVGRAEIPTVTRGQTFLVGFGADPQLRTRRELLDRTQGVQGGNREFSLRYALVIDNYKDQPATVRILDRLPYSSRTGEIRVTLKEPAEPLSTDKTYQRRERPKGILRWDIEVAPHATGDKARSIEYSYTVEFDRQYALTSPSLTPKAEQEFQQLERARMKK